MTMSDEKWLNSRSFLDCLSPQVSAEAAVAAVEAVAKDPAPLAGIVLAPHHIAQAGAQKDDAEDAEFVLISAAGYPTGRHHSLIKASEARLAVQSGAAEIWVYVDQSLAEHNAHLSEFITLREACPNPARLALVVPAGPARKPAVEAAELAGIDKLVITEPVESCLEKIYAPTDRVEWSTDGRVEALTQAVDMGAKYLSFPAAASVSN